MMGGWYGKVTKTDKKKHSQLVILATWATWATTGMSRNWESVISPATQQKNNLALTLFIPHFETNPHFLYQI
jgi:hypothetical protein